MSYEEVRCKLAEAYGWTFDVIDEMSFGQIRSAMAGGKSRGGKMPVNCREDVEWYSENWRLVHGIGG